MSQNENFPELTPIASSPPAEPYFKEPQSREQRNRWLDSVLDADPERPLPKVILHETHRPQLLVAIDGHRARQGDPKVLTSSYDVTSAEGEHLGFAVIKKPTATLGAPVPKYHIGDINIVGGKGYGPATYLAILKGVPAGGGLRTEGSLSNDARRLWKDLEAKGVAQRIKATGVDLSPDLELESYETIF